MRMLVLGFGIFFVVLSGVGPAHAADDGLKAGGKAVTLSAVTLDIVQNGRKVGSTKVPAGRSVDVVEVGEGRAKVATESFLSGWVSLSDLQMVAAAPSPAAQGELPPAAPQPETPAKVTRGQTSQIDIKETRTTEAIVAQPPSKCRGLDHFVSFQPTITRGSDLDGKEAVLRFYLIVMQEDKEKAESSGRRTGMRKTSYEPGVRRLKDVALPPDRAAIPPFRHNYIEGQCSCCRDLRHGELLGWYAELFDGGKMVDKTQSSMSSKALSALQDHLVKTE
jgi:hypothetical protein